LPLQTGLFSELIAEEREALAIERRSSLENPQTPLSYPAEWLLDIFNGGRTDSGIRVSELTALQCVTVLACVDIIAGKISSLPWHVFERVPGKNGRQVHRIAYEHQYYDLLHTEPNAEMTWRTLTKAYLCHALLWNGGYQEIQRDAGNQAVAIWPRNPSKTRPVRVAHQITLDAEPWRPFPVTIRAGEMCFETTDGIDDQDMSSDGAHGNRTARKIPMADMLHLPGLALDGRIGQSAVWLARNTLGQILAMEKFGSKYFANFAKPGGILEQPANLLPADKEISKRSWQEAQGGENAHRVAMLPPGWKFTPMSHNPQEAQTQEMRIFLRTEVASAFHVPARMAGDTSTKTRGSTEQENQELLDFALAPWIEAIRQEYKRKLFPHSGVGRKPKNPFFLDCDTWELVRGDSASREKFYASGRQWSYLSANDVRGFEKLNPVEEPWAEEYHLPINMTLASTPVDPTHQDGSGNGDVEPVATAYGRVFRDAYGRFLARDKRDLHAIQGCFSPFLYALRDLFGALAAREMRTDARPNSDSERFIAEYLATMQKRSSVWTIEAADETCSEELGRAAKAVRVAVYREIAAEKAKEPMIVG